MFCKNKQIATFNLVLTVWTDQNLLVDSAEPGPDTRSRVHTSLIVVLIITITSTLIVVAIFIYKRSPHTLPTFENPLYFGGQRSQPDVVDTNKLIENAEEENPEPIVSL